MKPLLEIATDDLRAMLLKVGHRRVYAESEEIFAEGDDALYLPVIITGKVKMVRYPEPGKEVIIGMFGNGEMFAVPPAFDGRTFPSTAVTMEETAVLHVYREDFMRLLRESPEFSFAVIEWMCEMLREKTATIQNLVTASPEHRVANVLMRVAKRENARFPFQIPMRRQDIAEMAGLTTETTIRTVKKLADKGVVKIVHGKIILEQPESLRRFLR